MQRTGAPGKNPLPPYCPGKGSDRCATSHPHGENPASQSPPDGMHPGTGCNSPSPRVQNAVRSGVAHTGIYEFHPGRPATRAVRFLSAAACQPRSARAGHRDDCGPAPQSHPAFPPAASLPVRYENTPPALRRYSRRAGTVHPPAWLSRSHTTPLTHTAGHAPESLIQSVSWDYCESLLMERKKPPFATLPRSSHPRIHLLHLSFRISVVGLSNSSATAGPLYPHSSPR